MASPRLPLPDYPWTTAYDALIAVLKEDPELRRVMKTWWTWEGTGFDLETPTAAHAPYAVLTPAPSPIRTETEGDQMVTFRVRAEFVALGTNARDLMNLWGAFQEALREDRPFRETTVRGHFRENGAHRHRVVEPGLAMGSISFDGVIGSRSQAVISMSLFVPY